MIKAKLIKESLLFLISFSLLFSSIVPFFQGSLFDYTFLLLALIFWIFIILNNRKLSILSFYIGIYFIISVIYLVTLFFEDASLFNYSLPIFLRINAFLVLIDLFLNIKIVKKTKFLENYFLLYPFILMSTICPIWAFYNSLLGFSWRIGFPLYSEGYDPHVFGPAMACSFITLTYVFFNKDYYFEAYKKKSLIINISLFIPIFSSVFAVFFSGSRGALLLVIGFLVTYLILVFIRGKLLIKIIPTKIKKSSIFLFGLSCSVFIAAFSFISNTSEKLGNLFFRTFQFLPLILGKDISRGNQFMDLFEALRDSLNNLLPKADIILTEQERFNLINVDVGTAYFIYNQGLVLFILFIIIYFFVFNNLKKINKISASLLSAGLILLIFGSATLLIPRFYLIYIYSIKILSSKKLTVHHDD